MTFLDHVWTRKLFRMLRSADYGLVFICLKWGGEVNVSAIFVNTIGPRLELVVEVGFVQYPERQDPQRSAASSGGFLNEH